MNIKFFLCLTLCLFIFFSIFLLAKNKIITHKGIELNKKAWEGSFIERGLPPPKGGPREGYWGSKISPKLEHPILGWIERKQTELPYFEIKDNGIQNIKSKKNELKILIVGASVAWGADASTIEKTYFSILHEKFKENNIHLDISILAAGGWKSEQELKALELYGLNLKADIVIFLNGLNDLVNGQNANLRYDDSQIIPKKIKDYNERVTLYIKNILNAYKILSENKIMLIVALQPTLFEKTVLSKIEEKLATGSYNQEMKIELLNTYKKIRNELTEISKKDNLYFFDLSKIFNKEAKTTFCDLWHFSDPGHEILANELYEKLLPIIRTEINNSTLL